MLGNIIKKNLNDSPFRTKRNFYET